MSRRDQRLIFGLLLLSAGAISSCDSPVALPDGVSLDVVAPREPALLTDTLVVVLNNSTSEAVTHTLCTAHLERLEGGQWHRVPKRDPLNRVVCREVLRVTEPGRSTEDPFLVGHSVSPGTFRVRAGVWFPERPGRPSRVLTSTEFEVR